MTFDSHAPTGTDLRCFAGLTLNVSGSSIILDARSNAGRSDLSVAALRDWLEQEGYGRYLIHEQALARVALDAVGAHEPFAVLVAQRQNAIVRLQVSEDAMLATLTVTPPMGGTAATIQDVRQALMAEQVVSGIEDAALIRAVDASDGAAIVVARGKPAQHGQDAVFEELIPAAPDRTPRLDKNGMIDYREHGDIVMVHTGALLMRRRPATGGAPGFTVRGAILPAKQGIDRPFAAQLSGTKVSDKDPNLLEAAQSGHPVRVLGGVMVEPVLRVAAVDMSSGNIRYDGTVRVDGDIGPGMRVEASGDVIVGGMIDGGIVKAGGDIKVSRGIVARTKLHAGGAITARFAETSQLYAGTVIAIDDMALECELQSLNQIAVGTKAPQRGRLIGGSATAMMLIKAPILGSTSAGVTRLVLGANPALEARYRELVESLAKERAGQESLRKLIVHLTARGDPKDVLSRAHASLRNAGKVLAQTEAAIDEVKTQLALSRNALVDVGVGLSGAVDISFGRIQAKLRTDQRAGTFRLSSESVIVYTDGSGYAVPVV